MTVRTHPEEHEIEGPALEHAGELAGIDPCRRVEIALLAVDPMHAPRIERNVIATLTLSGKDTAVDVDGDPAVRQRKRWASIGATYDDTILGVAAIVELRALVHACDWSRVYRNSS